MSKSLVILPIERIERVILLVCGEKVILDADLAALYGVETRVSCFNLRLKSSMI